MGTRERLVERQVDGSWRVPSNFLETVDVRDRRRVSEAPVAVEILSIARIDQLATADGVTWLDRQLLGGDGETPVRASGFGGEVKAALKLRERWLIEQRLAEPKGDSIAFRANLLAILRRCEL